MSIQVGDKVRVLNHDTVDENDLRGEYSDEYGVGAVLEVYRLADSLDRLMGAPEGAFFAKTEGEEYGEGFTPNNVEVINEPALMSYSVGDRVRLVESNTNGALDGALATVEAIEELFGDQDLTVRVDESAISDETYAAFEAAKADAEEWGQDTSTWDIQKLYVWDTQVEPVSEQVAA